MKKNAFLIIILGALTAFGPFSIDTYLPALPTVAADLATPISSIQLSISSYFFGMAFGQLFIGPISDRFGRKRPLYVGLALFILASLACAFAPSAPMLIAFRFVQALGGAAGAVISRAMVRDLFPPQETARVFSLLTLVMGVAPIIAPSIGGALLTLVGWRAIFGALALFAILASLAAWLYLPESRVADPTLSLRPLAVVRGYINILKHPQFSRFAFVGGLASAGMFAYIAGSAFVYIQYLNVSPTAYGWIFGVNALGFVTAGQINRFLLTYRNSEDILWRISPVQCVAGLCLVLVASLSLGGLPAMLVFNFIFVASLGFIMPNTTALALMPFTRAAGAASALMGSLQSIMATLASSAASALHNGTPVPMAGVMAVCGLLAFSLLQVAGRQPMPIQEPKPTK